MNMFKPEMFKCTLKPFRFFFLFICLATNNLTTTSQNIIEKTEINQKSKNVISHQKHVPGEEETDL